MVTSGLCGRPARAAAAAATPHLRCICITPSYCVHEFTTTQENYFLDDGAYGALKVVIEAVRRRLEGAGDIAELLADLR